MAVICDRCVVLDLFIDLHWQSLSQTTGACQGKDGSSKMSTCISSATKLQIKHLEKTSVTLLQRHQFPLSLKTTAKTSPFKSRSLHKLRDVILVDTE